MKKILADADALAEFSNLEPAGVEYFRRKYPDFVPSKWWEHRNGEQWRMTQGFLRESWENQFTGGVYYVARLILSVFDPTQTAAAVWAEDFPNMEEWVKEAKEQQFGQLTDIPWGKPACQAAVLHLFEHPWRAKFCPVCSKRFAAAEAKTKFCSQQCSDESSRRRHLEWARKNLKAWRRKQKAKKSRGRK